MSRWLPKLPVPFNPAQYLNVDTSRVLSEFGYMEIVNPGECSRPTVQWERNNIPDVPADYAHQDSPLRSFLDL